MLSRSEWRIIHPLLVSHTREIKRLREEEGISLSEARRRASTEVCDRFRELTGYEETNPEAIWHHRRSLYGPDCPKCGKPFRTPKASYCAGCGYTMGRKSAHPGARPNASEPPPSSGTSPQA